MSNHTIGVEVEEIRRARVAVDLTSVEVDEDTSTVEIELILPSGEQRKVTMSTDFYLRGRPVRPPREIDEHGFLRGVRS